MWQTQNWRFEPRTQPFREHWCMKCYSLNHGRLFAPYGLSPPGFSVHGILQARILQWVAISLQGIFPTQGLNLPLLPFRQIFYHLSHHGNPVSSEGLIWRGRRGTSFFFFFGNKDQVVKTSRDYHSIKKTRLLKLMDLRVSLCMGRCKSLGLLKSFLWYEP